MEWLTEFLNIFFLWTKHKLRSNNILPMVKNSIWKSYNNLTPGLFHRKVCCCPWFASAAWCITIGLGGRYLSYIFFKSQDCLFTDPEEILIHIKILKGKRWIHHTIPLSSFILVVSLHSPEMKLKFISKDFLHDVATPDVLWGFKNKGRILSKKLTYNAIEVPFCLFVWFGFKVYHSEIFLQQL